MTTYSKNIAVIKGIKSGFSPDGSRLSGIIKAENYGNHLKIEVTLINFAPLSGGRYVIALSDGTNEVIFDETGFDGVSDVRTADGFGAAVCFVINGEVNAIAAAICGDHSACAERAKDAIISAEGGKSSRDDNAAAGENFNERKDGKSDESGGAVRENKAQEEDLHCGQNEDVSSIGEEPQTEVERRSSVDSTGSIEENIEENDPAEEQQISCNKAQACYSEPQAEYNKQQAEPIPFAEDTGFYEKVREEAERIFKDFPKCEELEMVVEHSRWAKVTYDKGKHYVFGIIYTQNKPAYICYGVPSSNPEKPPQSLKGAAGYIPTQSGGYWVMYQDARTGLSIKIDNI